MRTTYRTFGCGADQGFGFVRIGLIVLTGFCMVPSLLVVAVASFLTVSSDTAALRDAVLATKPAEKRVAVSVGPLTCALAKYGARFLELPPEARLGIAAARGGEVCVYRLDRPARPLERARIMHRSDTTMEKRGWIRVAGVIHQEDLVAVYMPEKQRSNSHFKVCVLVLHERDMVVAAARGNIDPILELVGMHLDLNEAPLFAKTH